MKTGGIKCVQDWPSCLVAPGALSPSYKLSFIFAMMPALCILCKTQHMYELPVL